MKKLALLFSLCSIGFLFAMDAPMAGPAQEEKYVATLKKAIPANEVKIVGTQIQNSKVIVVGVSDPDTRQAQIVFTRFNADGTLDTHLNDKGFVLVAAGLFPVIESVETPSKGQTIIKGYYKANGEQKQFKYTFTLHQDGSIDNFSGKMI